MRHTRVAVAALAVGALSLLTFGQAAAQDAGPVTSSLRSFLGRYSKNLVAAAREMPAEKFGYSPTPDQMTFGHLVGHVAGSNNYLCASLSGLERPQSAEIDEGDKDALVEAMQASFDFCQKALERVTDAGLSEQVPFFGGRQASKATVALALVADWGDHYGQAANYLRLNDLLPPTAKREGEGGE